ncbi:MAG: hypothetical protein ACE5JC_00485 [Candidatus Zixiibacteriota bacterium]
MSDLNTLERLEIIRQRFTIDRVEIQLAGLAANLARVSSFVENPANAKAVSGLLVESKFMIEWIASNVSLEMQEQLVELQLQLAVWSRGNLNSEEISEQAEGWSERVLEMSGIRPERSRLNCSRNL